MTTNADKIREHAESIGYQRLRKPANKEDARKAIATTLGLTLAEVSGVLASTKFNEIRKLAAELGYDAADEPAKVKIRATIRSHIECNRQDVHKALRTDSTRGPSPTMCCPLCGQKAWSAEAKERVTAHGNTNGKTGDEP